MRRRTIVGVFCVVCVAVLASCGGESMGTGINGGGETASDSIIGPPSGNTALLFPNHGTLDAAGNVWVSVGGGSGQPGSVIEYTASQRQAGGNVVPPVVLGGFEIPEGLVFDASGNLWVADVQTEQVLEFTPAALAQSGTHTPNVVVSMAGLAGGDYTYAPLDLTIDRQGNFWVSLNLQTGPNMISEDSLPSYQVAEFTASQMAAGGAPGPVLKLTQVGFFPGGYGPGIAFDPGGNLWTANLNLRSLTKFPATSLVAGSNPDPSVTITSNINELDGVNTVAVDSSGALLVGNDREILKFQANQATESGVQASFAAVNADGVKAITVILAFMMAIIVPGTDTPWAIFLENSDKFLQTP